MPKIEASREGTFCWPELATTDQTAAKQFYQILFGWGLNEFPIGPDAIYSIFTKNGEDAAAACTIRPEQTAAGVPPNWLLYVAVDNADETAGYVSGLGGTLIAEPFDVGASGKMAVIQDPGGAVFALWQANEHKGIGIANEPGALCWAELNTPDPSKITTFYEGLLGWELTGDQSGYLHIKCGDDFIGGIPPAEAFDPKARPNWLTYFQAADCNAATAQAQQMGAKVYFGPQRIDKVGNISVLADPQGAVFALFTP